MTAAQALLLLTFDSFGRLWFATPQGVGVLNGTQLTVYTGAEGLPYNDFTAIAPGENGVVWFGTHKGAIRFDGKTWEYRQGPRWLKDDDVFAISVAANGDASITTATGTSVIKRPSLSLAEKARFFEAAIDRRHRRTPNEYVHPVVLDRPGHTSSYRQTDSDNDGLWTSMYGAGECFAYAATGNPESRRRAVKAFEALRFLGEVTQGGPHPAPKGLVARSILPTSGPDPNLHDSPERDRRMRETRDPQWKIISPRWPTSADGKWYWKSDTSSDELDGHFFFYAVYYDFAAQSPAEKQQVREHVAAIADHLIGHDYQYVDHDGRPTRWGIFNPENLNHNIEWWEERGLNSLSILTYLKVAGHITGDPKYAAAARYLIDRHSYAMNVLIPKTHLGPGGGNQSDDEMIFMNFYNLVRYEQDPELRAIYLLSFRNHWENERPEMNPLFNFLYAAVNGKDELIADSIDTLRRIPLDQINYPVANSHRLDVVVLEPGRGSRVNGKVLPADERSFAHWNHDPWKLDYAGDARTLGDGVTFLLPYYLGLYYKFIPE